VNHKKPKDGIKNCNTLLFNLNVSSSFSVHNPPCGMNVHSVVRRTSADLKEQDKN